MPCSVNYSNLPAFWDLFPTWECSINNLPHICISYLFLSHCLWDQRVNNAPHYETGYSQVKESQRNWKYSIAWIVALDKNKYTDSGVQVMLVHKPVKEKEYWSPRHQRVPPNHFATFATKRSLFTTIKVKVATDDVIKTNWTGLLVRAMTISIDSSVRIFFSLDGW